MESRLMWVLLLAIILLCMSSLSECRKTNPTNRTRRTLHKSRTHTTQLKNNALVNSRLPSGPSPGVGNSVPTNSISNRLSLAKHTLNSRLSLSGPSPGVGHSSSKVATVDDVQGIHCVIGKKMLRGSAFHNTSPSLIGSRLPSGPSPGSGHSFSPDSDAADANPTIANKLSFARGPHHHRRSPSSSHHDMA